MQNAEDLKTMCHIVSPAVSVFHHARQAHVLTWLTDLTRTTDRAEFLIMLDLLRRDQEERINKAKTAATRHIMEAKSFLAGRPETIVAVVDMIIDASLQKSASGLAERLGVEAGYLASLTEPEVFETGRKLLLNQILNDIRKPNPVDQMAEDLDRMIDGFEGDDEEVSLQRSMTCFAVGLTLRTLLGSMRDTAHDVLSKAENEMFQEEMRGIDSRQIDAMLLAGLDEMQRFLETDTPMLC